MLTNDIKKGTRVRLRNGWEADVMDNRKGNVRQMLVYGTYHETGDCYAHDIVERKHCGKWIRDIELTTMQEKLIKMNKILGF